MFNFNYKPKNIFVSEYNELENILYLYLTYGDDIDMIFEKYNKKYNIYNNCKIMYIESDSHQSLPKSIHNFKLLETLEIEGCRWFELDCNQIPNTIKNLLLNDQTNLPSFVCKNSNKLINLENLVIPDYLFFQDKDYLLCYYNNITPIDNINITPIDNINSLQNIFIHTQTDYSDEYYDLLEDWKNILLNNVFFINIKNRIKNINIIDDNNILTTMNLIPSGSIQIELTK
jgi:hypothetical protein